MYEIFAGLGGQALGLCGQGVEGFKGAFNVLESSPGCAAAVMMVVSFLMSILKVENIGKWNGSLFSKIPKGLQSYLNPFLYGIASVAIGFQSGLILEFGSFVSHFIAGIYLSAGHVFLYQQAKHTRAGEYTKLLTTESINKLIGIVKTAKKEETSAEVKQE